MHLIPDREISPRVLGYMLVGFVMLFVLVCFYLEATARPLQPGAAVNDPNGVYQLKKR